MRNLKQQMLPSLLKLLWHVSSIIGTVAMTSITIVIHPTRGHFFTIVLESFEVALSYNQISKRVKKLEVETNVYIQNVIL